MNKEGVITNENTAETVVEQKTTITEAEDFATKTQKMMAEAAAAEVAGESLNATVSKAEEAGVKFPPDVTEKIEKKGFFSKIKGLFEASPEKIQARREEAKKAILKHPFAKIVYAQEEAAGRGDRYLDASWKSERGGDGITVKYNKETDSYESTVGRGKRTE